MLPFRSGRVRTGRALFVLLLICALGSNTVWAEGKGKKHKKKLEEAKAAQEKKDDASNIPLPIGHEAKGLVLPDYDLRGRLSNRFDAGVAKRLDNIHLEMRDLKMTTYTAEQKPDLQINMSSSVLDLKTRVINSQQQTTVHRADFDIVGDTMKFDTTTRQGTLVGNVKMVIRGQSQLSPKGSE